MNPRELPKNRLATTDDKGNRIYLYPADVRGKFRALKKYVNFALVLIFLFLPWTHIGHHQTILLDIPQRRFAIFGLTFWAHDAPMLAFIFCGAILSLAFVTAIWGRFWCGWTCPQTVFTDGVFRRIERWIEGDSVQRKKLDEGPWNSEKWIKKTTKWLIFTLFAMIISHSFLAYFVGTETLAQMIQSSPFENQTSFLIMIGITSAILFDFGWFREQFCTLVCPYGRFQSVMMDDQSTVIIYDSKRGEPRRGTETPLPTGDCVNCYRCVQVCPTGVDIRRGVQLECIACTSCIDACDEVMSRLNKPPGLIRYGFYETAQVPGLKKASWYSRPRILVCGSLLLFCTLGLTATVMNRTPLEAAIVRAPDTPYQGIKGPNNEDLIINHFKIDARNQTFENQKIAFSVEGQNNIKVVVSNHPAFLKAGETERADLFLQFPKSILTSGHGKLLLTIRSEFDSASRQPITFSKELQVVGPLK